MVQVEARSENRSKQGEAGSRKGRNVWAKEDRMVHIPVILFQPWSRCRYR